MAREIHDTLCQGYVGISSQLNAVAARIRAHNCAADQNLHVANQHLELARGMARHSLTEAIRSVMDLRASVLEERDLPSALVAAATEWTAGSNTILKSKSPAPIVNSRKTWHRIYFALPRRLRSTPSSMLKQRR